MHCEIRPVRNFFAQRVEPAIVLYCKNPDEVFIYLHIEDAGKFFLASLNIPIISFKILLG